MIKRSILGELWPVCGLYGGRGKGTTVISGLRSNSHLDTPLRSTLPGVSVVLLLTLASNGIQFLKFSTKVTSGKLLWSPGSGGGVPSVCSRNILHLHVTHSPPSVVITCLICGSPARPSPWWGRSRGHVVGRNSINVCWRNRSSFIPIWETNTVLINVSAWLLLT